jgi:hydrogenase expression/formation protein HypC
MCLAIPGKIIEITDEENNLAKVDVGGVRRNINISMLEDVSVGDYVLIHVGFAMSKIDEQQALESLKLLQEMAEYMDEVEQFKNSIT